jgi:hypothetical protein
MGILDGMPCPNDEAESGSNKSMAALDSDSYLHWKEHLYKSGQRQSDSADFFSDALRSQHLEGKVGMRESVAIRNLPPERDAASSS